MIKYICDKCGAEINSVDTFHFPILDTSCYEFKEELDKLKEETEELLEAIDIYRENNDEEIALIARDGVIEESYDVIQVIINILYRLQLLELMSNGLEKHIEKLNDRGWEFKNKEQ